MNRGGPLRASAIAGAMISALAGLAACPDPKDKAPEQHCTKAYEKCVLASGVLGVCDNVPCQAGQSEPCLVCRSQH